MSNDFDFDIYTGMTVMLHLKDGSQVKGKYVGYTPAYDNDPEVTSVEVNGAWNYSVDAPDIDRIDIID